MTQNAVPLFCSTPRPTQSPWGQVDHASEVAPGIWSVATPSHGGILISQERFNAMPLHLRQFQTFAGPLAYEEDCDWSVVVEAFPELFGQAVRSQARATFTGWVAPKLPAPGTFNRIDGYDRDDLGESPDF